MFTAIVGSVTLLFAAFVIAWIASPALRRWVESPKYRMLAQEERFERAERHWPRADKPSIR